ncbi:GNAT family N-acetyltransferase [Rathayibacter sp. VKM Ac-2803]|uniref:GNAT family N-acetyltransferase n=1 Tax=unclassified Rathayibacter TaxID=2609250 RepID=UPI00135C3E3B|nr:MULTISPECIES: GNAT family N-acetyltransferase [unclassified Rathayibacter]MWV51053.1 GNAT family N-acetyltransferase [Rathayibacter sp. VKM Ac-2803]MWV57540.1 GNAT family N-acetyltransferase [Rathayibacter sp. VKM Ac-2754]
MTAGIVVRLERGDAADLAALLTPPPPRHARAFAARDSGGQLLGALALAPGPDDFAELLAATVLPAARRAGVARRLVTAAEAWARVQRIRTMRFRVPVGATEAIATASALGFIEIDGFGAHVGDVSGVCFAKAI